MCLGDFFWLSNKTWANRAVLTFFYSVYEKFLTQKKELLLLPLSKYICTFNLFVCHYGWVLHLVGFTWTSLCLGIFKETFTKRADFVCVYCRGYAEVGKLYRHNLKCVLCSQIKFQTSPHPTPQKINTNDFSLIFFVCFCHTPSSCFESCHQSCKRARQPLRAANGGDALKVQDWHYCDHNAQQEATLKGKSAESVGFRITNGKHTWNVRWTTRQHMAKLCMVKNIQKYATHNLSWSSIHYQWLLIVFIDHTRAQK